MKKNLAILSIVLLTALGVRAAWVYNAVLINNSALAYSNNYGINLQAIPNSSGITRLTAQAIYSSAVLTTDSFTDGRVSTASITVATIVGLSTATATDQITIAANAVIQSSAAFDTILVSTTGGLTGAYLTINGTRITNAGWRVDVTSNTAADIATQIGAYVYQVLANAHGGSNIILTARKKGVDGNAYTVTSSTPAALTVSGATFIGGKNPAFQNQYITVNGTRYARGYSWNVPSAVPETSTGTAASIATLMNRLSGIQAHASGSVVYATATVAGTAANAFTVVSSTPAAMTVANPTFTGGVSNACVVINGTSLCANRDWYVGASTVATAQSLSDAIVGNGTLATIVTSTWNTHAVINSTSSAAGASTTYTLTSSTPAALVVSNPTYTGGQTPAWTAGTSITIPSHSYGTAVAVVYSTSSGVTVAPLVNNTTYYVARIDANTIALSSTSAQAIAGTYISLAAPALTGPHTFVLTPGLYTGTVGLQWFVSNDGTNYNPLDISSVTYSVPSITPTSTLWDFGKVNYKYIQLDVTAPTVGALNLSVTVNGAN